MSLAHRFLVLSLALAMTAALLCAIILLTDWGFNVLFPRYAAWLAVLTPAHRRMFQGVCSALPGVGTMVILGLAAYRRTRQPKPPDEERWSPKTGRGRPSHIR